MKPGSFRSTITPKVGKALVSQRRISVKPRKCKK